jgi:hypothetical protein
MPEKILFNNYLKMKGKERKAENFNKIFLRSDYEKFLQVRKIFVPALKNEKVKLFHQNHFLRL